MALSAQTIFDRCAKHLLKQGEKSFRREGGSSFEFCKYRGPHGLKCAVGGILPDRLYKHTLEGMSVSSLMKEPGIAAYFGAKNERLLDTLQTVHDINEPKCWRDRLRAVARKHRLKQTVLRTTKPAT